jgi:hypothetical protein
MGITYDVALIAHKLKILTLLECDGTCVRFGSAWRHDTFLSPSLKPTLLEADHARLIQSQSYTSAGRGNVTSLAQYISWQSRREVENPTKSV